MDEIVQFGSASYKKDIQDAIHYQEELSKQRENEANSLENEVLFKVIQVRVYINPNQLLGRSTKNRLRVHDERLFSIGIA